MNQYVVASYTNMCTGNYVNIGAYVYDETEVESVFLKDMNRVALIFDGVRDSFFEEIVDKLLKSVHTRAQLDEVIKICNSPHASLQICPPKPVPSDQENVLSWVEKTILEQ